MLSVSGRHFRTKLTRFAGLPGTFWLSLSYFGPLIEDLALLTVLTVGIKVILENTPSRMLVVL
jgi:hypothetical protein